jgi:xylulokinase
MSYIGIDIGTFETKGVLVNADGVVLAMARRRHGITTPQPGHVEHQPDIDWWQDLAEVSQELMAHPEARQVDAVGVSAIGPCVVATDADLKPLRPAILYGVDTRATRQGQALTAQLGAEEVFRRGGNPLTSQSAGPKIAWIKEEEPAVWQGARWFMTSQSWLVAKLTGEVVIDHATAGYFHPLYDLVEKRWDVSGCEHFIDEARLPRLAWSTEVAGLVHARAAAVTGLPVGTPVIVGTTDSPAEAVGAGVVSDGALMAQYGSTGYFIRVSASPITHQDLWAAPFVFKDTYVLAAGTATLGTATRWISDLLGISAAEDDVTFGRLLSLAAGSPVGSRGVMVVPHFSGERTPFQDPDARASIMGLGLEHTQADVARAVLEGLGHSVAEALLVYERVGVSIDRVVAIGGATKNDVIMSTVSTVTGMDQDVAVSAGAAFGDAFLAAVGVGAIAGPSAGAGWWRSSRTVQPKSADAAVLRADHEDFTAAYRALAPIHRRRSQHH